MLCTAPCNDIEIQPVHFDGDWCPGSFYKLSVVLFQSLREAGVPESYLLTSQIGWSNKTYYCLLRQNDWGYEK